MSIKRRIRKLESLQPPEPLPRYVVEIYQEGEEIEEKEYPPNTKVIRIQSVGEMPRVE